MTFIRVLSSVNYGLVLIFGILLSAGIAGGCENARQKRYIVLACPVFLLLQIALRQAFGLDVVEKIYPLVVHLPLMLLLVLALKKTPGVALVSVYTAYLCCELPNWLRMLMEAATRSELAGELCYTVVIVPLFFVLQRYFVRAAHEAMTCSKTALVLFGSLPAAYYVFDYATTIYSNALYAGMRAVNESLPALLVTFYVVFLTAYHAQTERSRQAELQNSMLEAKWTQTQTEMDALRRAQAQTAVYRHDMRHHMAMLEGLLTGGEVEQAAAYIRSVQADIDAITPTRYCKNALVNLLCSAFSTRAAEQKVTLRVQARLPQQLPVSDTELCSMLSNGLENALRAAARETDRRWVELYCGVWRGRLLIEIKNPLDAPVTMREGLPVSDRPGHGYGCRSIRTIAEQHGGLCEFRAEDGVFLLRVVLPLARTEHMDAPAEAAGATGAG